MSRRGGYRSEHADSSNTNSDTIGKAIASGPLMLSGYEEPPMRLGVSSTHSVRETRDDVTRQGRHRSEHADSSNTNFDTIGKVLVSGPLGLSGYDEPPMRLGVSSTHSLRETNLGDVTRQGGHRSGHADSSSTNTGTIGRVIVSGPLVLSGYEEPPKRLGVSSTHSVRETNRGDISRRGGQRPGHADSSNSNTGTIGGAIVSGSLVLSAYEELPMRLGFPPLIKLGRRIGAI